MRAYEMVLVLKTSLSQAQREKLLETIKGWFGEAKVKKEEEWGQKPLSYPIKKEVSGFYARLWLESEKGVSLDLEKRLLANENVLRHLLIRTK